MDNYSAAIQPRGQLFCSGNDCKLGICCHRFTISEFISSIGTLWLEKHWKAASPENSWPPLGQKAAAFKVAISPSAISASSFTSTVWLSSTSGRCWQKDWMSNTWHPASPFWCWTHLLGGVLCHLEKSRQISKIMFKTLSNFKINIYT